MVLISVTFALALAGTAPPAVSTEAGVQLRCTGRGQPTVVLEPGASAAARDWSLVQPMIAERTRVCSARGGDSVNAPAAAGALRAGLNAAGEKPPFVLVGGVNARAYGLRYRDEIAGLVLVDAEDTDTDAATESHPLGDRPLVVLTRGTGATRARVAAHARLAGLSTNARHTIVAGAGAEIETREPTAVVAAVRDVVEAVARGKPLPRSEEGPRVDAARERVSLPTEDGGLVSADVYGQGERGVVLVHGGRFNKESWATQGRRLAEAGFHVLALDLRGYGQSKGPGDADPMSAPLHFDVATGVRHLRSSGAKTVSAVGGSMGGAPAAHVASQAGGIHRLVLLGSCPGEPAERLKAPTLMIMARDDANDAGPRLPCLRTYYDRAPEPKELVVVDGSAHAQFLFESDQAERVMSEILRFLAAP